ncbi:OmpW family outer membrane protein [Reinekea marinisedimentorum]|uniref:Opacity protein-like surface antigen n=1 Tax=Reinekea marinisedimentorum TaxID=230495 RepID=A0A4R3ID71_9GAMM|nr:OmpW family outer membrane protein [Reinekea marinisedimentorum]TCS43774.1 opacity protein-like surface antigen [Reinekea marinisedimentorum]
MMTQLFNPAVAIAVTLASAVAATAKADEPTLNTKLFIGAKTIDAVQWRAQDDHGSMGLLTDIKTGYHSVRVAIDLFASGSEDDTDSNVKGTYTGEAQLGLRKYCTLNERITPYLGGGVNFAYSMQENNDGSGKTEDEDGGVGYWMNVGVDLNLTENVNIGVDVRYATAEVELYDETVELDAATAGVTLGYRW